MSRGSKIKRVFRTYGFRWPIVLVAALLSISAWASRQPDAREQRELNRAIATIALTAESVEVSKHLSEMMAHHLILIEDAWDSSLYGQTSYPITGDQTVTINARAIPDVGAALYRTHNGPYDLFEDRIWLASVLVHEWLHTTQSWVFVHSDRAGVEPPAWLEQKRFLKRVRSSVPDDSMRIQRVDMLIDRVAAEIASD